MRLRHRHPQREDDRKTPPEGRHREKAMVKAGVSGETSPTHTLILDV